MADGHPHASLAVVPDCGHSITLHRPEGLLDAAGLWLATTGPA
jgi:pimeloyl-ACP methyl ester carboxylesterase